MITQTLTMEWQCPVCKRETLDKIATSTNTTHKRHHINCSACGTYILENYELSENHLVDFSSEYSQTLLCFAIRHAGINNEENIWTPKRVEHVIKNGSLPDPFEQANLLLEWIGNETSKFGKIITINGHSATGFIGSDDYHTLKALIEELNKQDCFGYTKINSSTSKSDSRIGKVKLSLKGWENYQKIKSKGSNSDRAFMAMKFGDEELNNLFENYLKPAVKQTGYNLFKLDDQPEAGLIDIRLRNEIKNSKFILADLTHANAGAYWEAGFAEGIGKPVIYTCKKDVFDNPDKKPHFDVNHHLTIIWDADNPDDAMNKLKAAIRYTLPEAKQDD